MNAKPELNPDDCSPDKDSDGRWWDSETPVDAAELAADEKQHPNTIRRYMREQNQFGLTLESFWSRGKRMTTREAYRRFEDECNRRANARLKHLNRDLQEAAAEQPEGGDE